MEYVKQKKSPIFIALIQWFITTVFQVDRLFFTYEYENKYFLGTKFLYLIFLLVSWCFIFEAVKKIKAGDQNWKRGFFVFKVYLFITMFFLLILWPGTWAWDDVFTLNGLSQYNQWYSWQHIITGAYQDVLLQILPFPGGIILLQNVLISLCVAFTVTRLEAIFGIGMMKNEVLDTIVKLLPFLLPPVLSYQFSGYRIGFYVYIELVMLVMMIGIQNDQDEWDIRYLILFCVLCVVVSVWRTESFFYIPCAFLLVLSAPKSVISNKKKILCILLLIIGIQGINKFQNSELENADYEVISLMRPCVELVRAADCTEDADVLREIDRVVSLEVIHNNPVMNGEGLYWSTDVVKESYSDEDYKAFLKAIVKLSIKYPKVVFAERWNIFIHGSGVTGGSVTNIGSASSLFDAGNDNSAAQIVQSKEWIANSPVFKTARKTVINALGKKKKKSDGSYISVLQRLVWNAIIPELILMYAWFKLLIEKKWHWLGICTAVLIRIPVVILTQPAHWFMYMLSFYFLGYIFLIYRILVFWSIHKKEIGFRTG